jgi:capsular polysaccharide biosynthesis protein
VEPREATARILSAHRKLIVGLVLAGVAAAFLLHLDDRELFTASARVSLATSDPKSAAEAQAIADTTRAIATSFWVVEEALARAGVNDVSAAGVARFAAENVHVQGLGSSDVMELSVTYPIARTAADIANQLADRVIKTRLQATRGGLSQIIAALDNELLAVDQEIAKLRLTGAEDARSTRERLAELNQERSDLTSQRESVVGQDALRPQPLVVDPAHAPVAPDPSRRVQDVALGALLGLVAGIGLAATIETITPTLVGAEAVAREVGAPILAELPRANGRSTAFQRDLEDNHVRLAAGFARMGSFELADLGPVTMATDVALLAARLSDPIRRPRVRVTGGEHLVVRSVTNGDATTSNGFTNGDATTIAGFVNRDPTPSSGLVVVTPTVVKKRKFQWVASSLHTGELKVFGVVTYPPTGPLRSVGHRLSRALERNDKEKRDEPRDF